MAAVLSGQQASVFEAPRSLTGSATFGWLNSSAQETFSERRSNPFTSLQLDFRSYLIAPDFLTYRVQPRLSSGFQDALTGLSEGSGVAFETVVFPRRPWPFRFHFSRFRRQSLTTGLEQSYTRFISQNDDTNYGFQWQYVVPHLPAIEASLEKVSSTMTPEAVLTQGFATRSRTFNLSSHDVRWGWTLNGGVSMQNLNTQYLLGSNSSAALVDNLSNLRNTTFMAQRPIAGALAFSFSANRSMNRSNFDRGSFDQSFESYSARLEYRPEGRFQAWTQSRLMKSDLESHPSAALGTVQLPPSVKIANEMQDSEARFEMVKGVDIFGRNEYTHVRAPSSNLVQRGGNFVNSGAGVQVARSHKTLVYSGSYYAFSTLTRLDATSPGSALGHAVDSSIAAGDPSRLRVGGSFSWNTSHEDVRNLLPFTSEARRAQLSLSKKLLHLWTIEAQGALTRSHYSRQEVDSNFHGKDYGISIAGQTYYLGYNRSLGSGGSLQQILGAGVNGPIDFTNPLVFLLGSGNSTTTINASWNITRQISLRGVWRGQAQTIGSDTASRFEEREATFAWQFRKVRLEAGYLLYRFDFGSPIQRRNLIVRVTRDFQIF